MKLLDRENCPKSDGDGRAIVSALASTSDIVISTQEELVSNASEFRQIPTQVSVYTVLPSLSDSNLSDAFRDWAFYPITPHRVVAFHPPGDGLRTWLNVNEVRSYDWQKTPEIEGVKTENIVVALLRRCVESRCKSRGFRWSGDVDAYCCELNFAKNLPVRLPSGEKTTVQSSGQRTFFRVGSPKILYRYWLAVRPTIVRNLFDEFSLVWQLQIHFTDTKNVPIPTTQRQSRRKHTTREWRNRHWLVRHLGVIQYLADSENCISIGPDGSQQVILDCSNLTFAALKGIDESKIDPPEEISDELPVEDEPELDDLQQNVEDIDGE